MQNPHVAVLMTFAGHPPVPILTRITNIKLNGKVSTHRATEMMTRRTTQQFVAKPSATS